MNTNRNSTVKALVIIGIMVYTSWAFAESERKYASICGVAGEMKLSALVMQKSLADRGIETMSEEELKELSDLAVERRFGCD